MAKYEYKCDNCDEQYTIEKSMKDAGKEEYCIECNSVMRRVFNATPTQWKCSGAYVTDNRGGR